MFAYIFFNFKKLCLIRIYFTRHMVDRASPIWVQKITNFCEQEKNTSCERFSGWLMMNVVGFIVKKKEKEKEKKKRKRKTEEMNLT